MFEGEAIAVFASSDNKPNSLLLKQFENRIRRTLPHEPLEEHLLSHMAMSANINRLG